MRSSPIRIVIADDHRSFRRILARVLNDCEDIHVVGEAENGDAAEQLARELLPSIVLMDRCMPGMDSLRSIHHIVRDMPDVQVIGLSSNAEAETPMLNAGAVAFVDKTSDDMYAICDTIRWAVQ